MKKIISFVISLVIVLTSFNMDLNRVDAATVSMHWVNNVNDNVYESKKCNMIVELGQNFNIGDWIMEYSPRESGIVSTVTYVSQITNAKYSSSNSKIVSVSKKGDLAIKKTGNVKITIKFRGITATCNMTVVKKNKCQSSNSDVKKITKDIQKLAKYYGKGLAEKKNRLDIVNLLVELDYEESAWLGNSTLLRCGTITEEYGAKQTDKIAVPLYGLYKKIRTTNFLYAEPKSIINVYSKSSNIDRYEATQNKVTFYLKNEITEDQLFNEKYMRCMSIITTGGYWSEQPASYMGEIYITDGKSKTPTRGIMKLEKGKKSFTVTFCKKLKKGKRYYLEGSFLEKVNAYNFKVS